MARILLKNANFYGMIEIKHPSRSISAVDKYTVLDISTIVFGRSFDK